MHSLKNKQQVRVTSVSFFCSKMGEFSFETTFAVLAISLTDADLGMLGLIYFFRYIPSIALTSLAGWLADNYDTRRVLRWVEWLKSIVLLSLFFTAIQPVPSLLLVVMLAMLITSLDCLYAPSFRTLCVKLVERKALDKLNSGIQVLEDSAAIAGPLMFSALSSMVLGHLTFLLGSLCMAASAISTLLLAPQACTKEKPKLKLTALLIRPLERARKLPSANADLFNIIACTSLCAMFATSLIRFILPAAVIVHFSSEAVVGYVMALLAASTVLGGLCYPLLSKACTPKSVHAFWMIYSFLFMSTAFSLSVSDWLFFVLLFGTGFAGAFVDIAITTNIQTLSSENEIGSNFSIYYFSAVLGDALSGVVANGVILLAGPATFIWMSLFLLLTSSYWTLKRRTPR
ncbi:MFS transporter [Pseudomonas sp. MLB6B]